jgi:hypothetical protein
MLQFAAAAAAVAIGLVAPANAADKPPKVGEVDYSKQSGDQGPATSLLVFFKPGADAVELKARSGDEKARATGQLNTHVETHRYGNPWQPAKAGRRALLNVMKDSIAATGAVTLTVVAENDLGQRSKTRVEIVMSECDQDPPLYPFTCVVKP